MLNALRRSSYRRKGSPPEKSDMLNMTLIGRLFDKVMYKRKREEIHTSCITRKATHRTAAKTFCMHLKTQGVVKHKLYSLLCKEINTLLIGSVHIRHIT